MSRYDKAIEAYSPVANWPLSEESGTAATDEAGSADGVYINTPTLGVAGLETNSVALAVENLYGDESCVTVADTTVFADLTGPFSIAMSFNFKDQDFSEYASPGLLSVKSSSTNPFVILLSETATYADLVFGVQGVGTWYVTADLTATVHVLISYDGTDYVCYINGTAATATSSGAISASTNSTILGAFDISATKHAASAVLGRVSFFDVEITAAQASAIYLAFTSGVAISVYRSDDVGAPDLDGTRGSLIDVIRAVAVDGYNLNGASGAAIKIGAGWTMALDNETSEEVIIIRNDPVSGTGKYIRIQDNGHENHTLTLDGTHQGCAYVRGCESFNAADSTDTSGNFPNIGLLGDSNADTATYSGMSIFKHTTDGGTTTVPWIIMADDRTMNIIIFSNAPNLTLSTLTQYSWYNWFVWGDVEPLNGSVNPYACTVWGNSYRLVDGSSYIKSGYCPVLDGYKYMNRGYEGNAGAIELGVYSSKLAVYAGSTIGGYSNGAGTAAEKYPNTAFGGMVYGDFLLYEDTSKPENTDTYTVDTNTIHARLRGVLSCAHPMTAGTITFGVGAPFDELTLRGDTYMVGAGCYNGSNYAAFFQLDGLM